MNGTGLIAAFLMMIAVAEAVAAFCMFKVATILKDQSPYWTFDRHTGKATRRAHF